MLDDDESIEWHHDEKDDKLYALQGDICIQFKRASNDTTVVTYGFSHYDTPTHHAPPTSTVPAKATLLSKDLAYMESPTPPSTTHLKSVIQPGPCDIKQIDSSIPVDFDQSIRWTYSESDDKVIAEQGDFQISYSRASDNLPHDAYGSDHFIHPTLCNDTQARAPASITVITKCIVRMDSPTPSDRFRDNESEITPSTMITPHENNEITNENHFSPSLKTPANDDDENKALWWYSRDMKVIYTKKKSQYIAYNQIENNLFKKLGYTSPSDDAITITIETTTQEDVVHFDVPNEINDRECQNNSPPQPNTNNTPGPTCGPNDTTSPPLTQPREGRTQSFTKEDEKRIIGHFEGKVEKRTLDMIIQMHTLECQIEDDSGGNLSPDQIATDMNNRINIEST